MFRLISVLAALLLAAGCTETLMNEEREDLGAFKLRVSYVFADNAVKGPVSRDASPQEWVSAIENAVDGRLRRYDGPQEYDLGISLEGYMLAPPGVPVLYSPKSTAIILVHVYDVGQEEFLVRKHQIQVLENTTGESLLVGSGHSRTKQEQIAGLALNAVDAVEEWLAEQHGENGWFDLREPVPEVAVLPE